MIKVNSDNMGLAKASQDFEEIAKGELEIENPQNEEEIIEKNTIKASKVNKKDLEAN